MDTMQEALIVLGCSNNEAKVISYLTEHDESFQRDIERACDLRQPEVSIALTSLKKLGVVQFEPVPSVRGRSLKKYSLLKSMLNKVMYDKFQKEMEMRQNAMHTLALALH